MKYLTIERLDAAIKIKDGISSAIAQDSTIEQVAAQINAILESLDSTKYGKWELEQTVTAEDCINSKKFISDAIKAGRDNCINYGSEVQNAN
jgi:hypothetical protein